MKLYIKMIKPMLSVPTSSQDYTPKHILVESEGKWYQEEERESLIKKYEHLETTFEHLVFEEKYKEFEIVLCKKCKYCEYPKSEKEWCKKGHLHGNAEHWFCADGERR